MAQSSKTVTLNIKSSDTVSDDSQTDPFTTNVPVTSTLVSDKPILNSPGNAIKIPRLNRVMLNNKSLSNREKEFVNISYPDVHDIQSSEDLKSPRNLEQSLTLTKDRSVTFPIRKFAEERQISLMSSSVGITASLDNGNQTGGESSEEDPIAVEDDDGFHCHPILPLARIKHATDFTDTFLIQVGDDDDNFP